MNASPKKANRIKEDEKEKSTERISKMRQKGKEIHPKNC